MDAKVIGEGVLQEVRGLKDKQGAEFKKIAKVATLGCVLEMTVPPDVQVAPNGSHVAFEGSLGTGYKGALEVTLRKMTPKGSK